MDRTPLTLPLVLALTVPLAGCTRGNLVVATEGGGPLCKVPQF